MKYVDLEMSLSTSSWTLLQSLATENIETHGHIVDMTTRLNDTDILLTYTVYETDISYVVSIKEERRYNASKAHFEVSGYREVNGYNPNPSNNKTQKRFPLAETEATILYIKLLIDNFLKEVSIQTLLEE